MSTPEWLPPMSTDIAIAIAERDLVATCLHQPELVPVVVDELRVGPRMLRDPRLRGLLAVLIDVVAEHAETADVFDVITRIAELRRDGSDDYLLSRAVDLDGYCIVELYAHPFDERDITEVCEFLTSMAEHSRRDEAVEACIAALARGASSHDVRAFLTPLFDPTAVPHPHIADLIRELPPTPTEESW